jgi:hypothetical protein
MCYEYGGEIKEDERRSGGGGGGTGVSVVEGGGACLPLPPISKDIASKLPQIQNTHIRNVDNHKTTKPPIYLFIYSPLNNLLSYRRGAPPVRVCWVGVDLWRHTVHTMPYTISL